MNPFASRTMFFGPMGMSVFPVCNCGVSMPFYGIDDRLSFMNFPVFRDTSKDFLLNPMLAIMQCRQPGNQYFNNFSTNYLPLFNNFPGMNNNWSPWSPWTPWNNNNNNNNNSNSDTPEVKKQKEKIEALKDLYDKYKSHVNTSSRDFKDLEREVEAALKEEKTEDQLKKLEAAMNKLTPRALRKTVLSNPDIDSKLYKMGYNYPSDTSYKHEVKDGEVNWNEFLTSLNLADANSVGSFGPFVLNNHKGEILQVVSTWNDTHSDDQKGILRGMAKHLPNDSENQQQYKAGIVGITDALAVEAKEFMDENGGTKAFPKLSAQLKALNTKAETIKKKDVVKTKITKSEVNALANEFDKLYAMLRVQEARVINSEIVEEYAKDMNALKEGTISEDIIIKETIEDLKSEKVDIPKDSELDTLPEKISDFEADESVDEISNMEEIDDETDGKPTERINKLVEADKLETVSGHEGIYSTKLSGNNVPKKYYKATEDGKLVEINFSSAKKEPVNQNNVSAVDIATYVKTAEDIEGYIADKKIEVRTNMKIQTPKIYKSKDADEKGYSEMFYIKDNKFVKVNGTVSVNGWVDLKNGGKKLITNLTDDDVTVVTSSSDIYTKPVKQNESVPENSSSGNNSGNSAEQTIDESVVYETLTDAAEAAKNAGYSDADIEGYFVKTEKNGSKIFYRYENEHLVSKPNIKNTNKWGQIYDGDQKKWVAPETDLSPSDLGQELRRKLNGDTSVAEYNRINQIMTIFESYTEPEDIITFIEKYTEQMHEDEKTFLSRWNDELCAQISTENRYGREAKTRSLKIIAKQIKKVMEKCHKELDAFGPKSEEYEDMVYYAEKTKYDSNESDGGDSTWRKEDATWRSLSFWSSERTGAANNMDDIIEDLIDKYREKFPKEKKEEQQNS